MQDVSFWMLWLPQVPIRKSKKEEAKPKAEVIKIPDDIVLDIDHDGWACYNMEGLVSDAEPPMELEHT